MDWLRGKKTYLVAFAMVILSGLRAQGYITQEVYEAILALLLGGGLAALRVGLKK